MGWEKISCKAFEEENLQESEVKELAAKKFRLKDTPCTKNV